jgi:magnesium chelatase subunit H
MNKDERDRQVLDLWNQLLEIEQRLIPTGLHVFGRPATGKSRLDLLCQVASFDRPEEGTRSLPDLIAAGRGWPDYPTLIAQSANDDASLARREEVEGLMQRAIEAFLVADAAAAVALLESEAKVDAGDARPVLALLAEVNAQLDRSDELQALSRALRGEYIEPGPGADIVQNPRILPTGRNTCAINPYHVPSPDAFVRAEPIVSALLARHHREAGRYPESMAMVLWGLDNIKTQGEGVAQALWLLGVRPRRDRLNRATEVEAIPLSHLGRPRIDLVLTLSGIFRDLFGPTMDLLDKAVRCVVALDEPDQMNYPRRHFRASIEAGLTPEEAVIRLFSNAPGNYGTNVNFMVMDGQWDHASALGDLFVKRKSFAYGRDGGGARLEGRAAGALMDRALAAVEATYQPIDSIEIGITDIDHYFEYLGGVSKAVETRAGKRPRIYLSDSTSSLARVRTLEETVRLETRTKTLNPKWYEGMLGHGFRGVAEIEHRVTNTFGWSATADAVEGWIYDDVAGTFALDEAMLERLRELNPHSTRNLVGRLLEAEGRGFWHAEPGVAARLRDVFASLEDQLEGVST